MTHPERVKAELDRLVKVNDTMTQRLVDVSGRDPNTAAMAAEIRENSATILQLSKLLKAQE